MTVFSLSVHADYACRHSGACCTAGWSIPVQPAVRPLLRVDLLAPAADGACPEYDRAERLCRVHRDHGETALPEACYHFPRRALTDGRGTFVTVSHFCPTAASLLFRDDVGLAIVESPPAFPPERDYDPLDGCDAWPPLVRPNVLFDLRSYSRWERFVVDTLAVARPVAVALGRIASAAEHVRRWSPAGGPLDAFVDGALRAAAADGARGAFGLYDRVRASAFEAVISAVPDGLPHPDMPTDCDASVEHLVDPVWDRFSTPVRRYLAAKAFGSWSAYQGRGLRTLVAELVASAAVLRIEAARACGAAGRPLDEPLLHEAVRQTDWLLMHLVDRTSLMRWCGRAEDDRWLNAHTDC